MDAPTVPEAVRRGQVAERARQCLRRSPYRVLRQIRCDCTGGVLVLSGRLTSFFHKQLAQEAVARVEGAITVDNQIEVAR